MRTKQIKTFICIKKLFSNRAESFSPVQKDKIRSELYSSKFDNLNSVLDKLKIVPEETDEVINHYLHRDLAERALEIFKHNKSNVTAKTYLKLESILLKRVVGLPLNKFLKSEVGFSHLFDFLIYENPIVLSKVLNILCKNEKYKEAYKVLTHFNFSSDLVLNAENNNKLFKHLKTTYGHKVKNKNKENFLECFKDIKELEVDQEQDCLGPCDPICLQFSLKQSDIHLVDEIDKMDLALDRIKHSDFLGIDCEWKPFTSGLDDTNNISIIQISDLHNVVILDLQSLGEKNTLQALERHLKGKTLICHAFNNDIKKFGEKIKQFFLQETKLIEIKSILKDKELKSLSKICKYVYDRELCKAEQCSNWQIRPLRLRQIHYAALDSYLLTKLYANRHFDNNKYSLI